LVGLGQGGLRTDCPARQARMAWRALSSPLLALGPVGINTVRALPDKIARAVAALIDAHNVAVATLASFALCLGWNPARLGVGCERHPGPAGLAFALHEHVAGALPSQPTLAPESSIAR
jgi:hypothetical protein